MVQKGRNNAACTSCSWQEAIVENPDDENPDNVGDPDNVGNPEELAPVGD